MSPVDQDGFTVLALDIGTVHTRALLFEVVEEAYHFIASSVTQTTNFAPVGNLLVGVFDAIRQLQELTGHTLLSQRGDLIIPSQVDGEGVDRLFIAYSIGDPLKVATFGLIGDVSQLSVNRLAATIPGKIVETVGLNDPRPIQKQIDDTLLAEPDLILLAGGTDRGASRSVKKMANLVTTVLQLIPQSERPPVLFAGNQLLDKTMQETIGAYTQFVNTANIRPDMEHEELEQASEDLSKLITSIHSNKIEALKQLTPICSDAPCLSATAIGRITRFLSKVGDPEKGALAIDLGAASTIAASASAGVLSLNVFQVGSAQGFEKFLKATPFEEISQWFPAGTLIEDARDQLWQKTLFPASIPITHEALAVEQAAYRQLLRYIMREMAARNALQENGYETILCSGAAITQGTNPNQLLMMLLDGLQPKGVSTLILDSHSILSTMGAIARSIPVLPVQVLESSAFTNLATVVSVDSSLRAGSQVLRARMTYKDGKVRETAVKQGSLAVLPLRTGEEAVLDLELSRLAHVENSELAETHFKVNGGLCGLVIDARGRPIKLPNNPNIRGELFSRWNSMLNGK
jgi:uncharacterized protein (TIGR01319 family)